MNRPPAGICLPCQVHRVRDGDTVEVRFGSDRVYAIRLLDCWAPELRPAESREAGLRAKEAAVAAIEQNLEEGEVMHVFIPLPDDTSGNILRDLLTFDRILGHLYINPETTLSEHLVRYGYATREKS